MYSLPISWCCGKIFLLEDSEKIVLISHIYMYLYHICLKIMKVQTMHFHTYPLFRTIKFMLLAIHHVMRDRHPLILKC